VAKTLCKAFDGIYDLDFKYSTRFNEQQLEIVALKAADGETLELTTGVFPSDHDGALEEWMLEIRNQMRVSVRRAIHEGLLSYPRTHNHEDF
jgi:hypothetical protein